MHGWQLLPQHSPTGGFSGLERLLAAASSASSRIGASLLFRSRVKVGELDLSSLVVDTIGY